MKGAGGAEFRASTAQRFAALADANRQGEHAAVAAWLVRRCELLWSRGYFSKSRESDQQGRPFGIVVLSTLAADYLSGCACICFTTSRPPCTRACQHSVSILQAACVLPAAFASTPTGGSRAALAAANRLP